MKYAALLLALLACVACVRPGSEAFSPQLAVAQVRAQSGPGVAAPAIPYARPDLSSDPAERAKAYAMREALARHDNDAARKLATTRALREMFNEAQHEKSILLRNT